MASKAYVASMTVAELTTELKQRGLSCRGKKKALQARLEEALEDEELSESSSEGGAEATIRAASAVINQLQGDGKEDQENNFSVDLYHSEVKEEEEEQQQLVVSIEHSKRYTTNPKLVASTSDVDMTSNGNTSQENTCAMTSENKVDSNNVSEDAQFESISTVMESEEGVESVSKEAELPESKYESVVTHEVKEQEARSPSPLAISTEKESEKMVTEVTSSVQSEIIESNQVKVTEDDSMKMDDVSTITGNVSREVETNSELVHVPQQVEDKEIPTDKLPAVDDVTENPLQSLELVQDLETSPAKVSFMISKTLESTPLRDNMEDFIREPLMLSPHRGDVESGSEVNSITVEPPSPIRDEISVVAEEGFVSFSAEPEPEVQKDENDDEQLQKEENNEEQLQKEENNEEQLQKEEKNDEQLQKDENNEEQLQKDENNEEQLQKEENNEEQLQKDEKNDEQLQKEENNEEQLQKEENNEEQLQKDEKNDEQLQKEENNDEQLQKDEKKDEQLQKDENNEEQLQKDEKNDKQLQKDEKNDEQLQKDEKNDKQLQKDEEQLQKDENNEEQLQKEENNEEQLQKDENNEEQLQKEENNKEQFHKDDLEESEEKMETNEMEEQATAVTQSELSEEVGEQQNDIKLDQKEEQTRGSEDLVTSSEANVHVDGEGDPSGVITGEDDGKIEGSGQQKQVVSCQSALDSGPIEVDVLVPTVEEDDFSAFSVEAAEVRNLDSATSDKKRPSTLLSSSDKAYDTGDVTSDGVTNSHDIETFRKRHVSVPEGMEKDTDRAVTSTAKRRRISTSPRRSQERRRKWGSSVSRTPTSTLPAISSDVLETIIPIEVKEEVAETMSNMSALEAVMKYGNDEEEKDEQQQEMKQDEEDILDIGKEGSMMDEYEQEWKDKEREREEQKRESVKAKQELETRRRIEARVKAKQEREKEEKVSHRSPSPSQKTPNRILHIENLTRPFTILQLKELLQEDGVLVKGGFWTNRIKSHCIAIYVTLDSAIATRNRLHGLKWPSTNPKLLRVDYLSNREVPEVSEGQLIIQSRSPTPTEGVEKIDKREGEKKNIVKKSTSTERKRSTSTRDEQDIIKKNVPEKKPPLETKEEKKMEEKQISVLDDLFRKTKATPSIYWLPLSEEEAAEKEKERKTIEAERDQRREERQKEREREMMLRERRIREEREQRARERMRRRSHSRSRSPRRRSRSPPRKRSHSPRRRSRSPRQRSLSNSRSPVKRQH